MIAYDPLSSPINPHNPPQSLLYCGGGNSTDVLPIYSGCVYMAMYRSYSAARGVT